MTAKVGPVQPEPVSCERCRFPNPDEEGECVNCRWPIDTRPCAVRKDVPRGASTQSLRPVPVMDLCGPQLRVLDFADQIRSALYWRMVRELAEKAYEAGPHDQNAQREFMRQWWKERAAESEAVRAAPNTEGVVPTTPADVALSPINILNWSAHLDGFKRLHPMRFFAAADEADALAFIQYLAECAFFSDVRVEIHLIANENEETTLSAGGVPS